MYILELALSLYQLERKLAEMKKKELQPCANCENYFEKAEMKELKLFNPLNPSSKLVFYFCNKCWDELLNS